MKLKRNLLLVATFFFGGILIFTTSCKKDKVVDPGTSTTELLVKQFDAAPTLDGNIDEMWSTCQTLTGTTVVPDAGQRGAADYNGDGSTAPAGIFEPYTGEENNFEFKAGTYGDKIYFLLKWDDPEDSKDRMSWYFDATDNLWKQQHKYANNDNDKYYEDKFAMLWAATAVQGFDVNTCYATCHQGLTLTSPSDKATRHYTSNPGEIVDMWHWKRVRCSYEPTTIDDQQMVYKENTGEANQNGRTGDEGDKGYHDNKQTLALDGSGADVTVPLYVIPNETDYAYITKDQISDGSAKMITAVASDGTLTYAGGTIDPSSGGYENATGNKRVPSVYIESFTGSKADIAISAVHTADGWVCEFSRKLDTGHTDDVKFEITKEYPFGLAIFNNAAIAHEIKTNLLMKFETAE